MRDANTGQSRGFGFLTMANPDDVDKIVQEEHYLDGKKVKTELFNDLFIIYILTNHVFHLIIY